MISIGKNIGDRMDYAQRKNNDIGEAVRNTLEMLETYGGPNALKSIKFSVPTYQSCIQPTNFRHEGSIYSSGGGGGSVGSNGTGSYKPNASYQSSITTASNK